MLAKLFLQYVLAVVLGVGIDDGYATIYGTPGDPHATGNLACQSHRGVPQDEALCAHRWLPCGTHVTVVNLERQSVSSCTVADRGPFGADRDTGRWKGLIDLTPKAAKDARLDGRDVVRLVYHLPAPGHAIYGNPRFLAPLVAQSSKAASAKAANAKADRAGKSPQPNQSASALTTRQSRSQAPAW